MSLLSQGPIELKIKIPNILFIVRDKKQGHSRRCRLEEHKEFWEKPFECKMLVSMSLLLIKARQNQD